MTKHPTDLEDWLRYHRAVLGVERFFLRVEDSPEVRGLLLAEPWASVVDATFVEGTDREYFDVMRRQELHVSAAITRAQALGLHWLLHLDDDELVHCPSGELALWEELRRAPPAVFDVHLPNVEALAPDVACERPFVEATCFLVDRSLFTTYTNGKSLGRLSERGLATCGVHYFRAVRGGGGHGGTLFLSPACAVVLHYESCTFAGWCRKYADLAERHDRQSLGKLPFSIYRNSIVAAGELRRLRRGPARREADVAAARRIALAVWERAKLQDGYPAASTARVTAARQALLQGGDRGGS